MPAKLTRLARSGRPPRLLASRPLTAACRVRVRARVSAAITAEEYLRVPYIC